MKMKKTVIALIFLLFSILSFAQNINTFGGVGRYGATKFVIDNTVYIGLGEDENQSYKDFWKYSSTTGSWEQIANFPGDPRSNALAFSVNGIGYVGIGNYYESNVTDTIFKDFYSYNPTTNTWTKLNDFTGGAKTKAVGFMLNDTAYIGTGGNKDVGQTKDFWKYHVTSDSWTQLTAEFTGNARYGATAFTVNGKAYVSGGGSFGSYYLQLSDIQEYNPLTKIWTERLFADGLNLSFNNATAFGYGGKGYICYGNKDYISSYNPVNNQVEKLGNVLTLDDQRMWPISFILDDAPYFGLGLFSYDDGSTLGKDTCDRSIYTLNLPNPGVPLVLQLSNDTVQERLPDNTLVGYLRTTTVDEGSIFTYSLSNTNSYPNNELFTITDSSLLAKTIDYSDYPTLQIQVRTTNTETGKFHENEFTVLVKENIPFGINPFAGEGRRDAVEFTIGDTVYIGLGRTYDKFFSDFWKYTPTSNKWQRLKPFPGGKRIGATAFTIGNTAYVGLGSLESYSDLQNDFYSYSVETDTWTQIADFAGDARREASLFVIDSIAYVGCGSANGDQFNDFWKYDPKLDAWNQTSAFSGGKRAAAAAFNITKKGYVAGGYYEAVDLTITPYGDLHEYDPETGIWTKIIDNNDFLLPYSYGATAFVYNNKAFICYALWSDEILVFNPETDSITSLGDMLDFNMLDYPLSFILKDSVYLGLGESKNIFSKDILKIQFPEPPTAITLSDSIISENRPWYAFIGNLSISDKSLKATHTYSLSDEEQFPDNKVFRISDSTLHTGNDFDYDTKEEYQINVEVTNNYDSTYTQAFTIYYQGPNGIDKNIADKYFNIYPNPVNSILHVIPHQNNSQVLNIQVYSPLGQKILEKTNSNEIDLSSIPSGIYILRINTTDRIFTKQIVVE